MKNGDPICDFLFFLPLQMAYTPQTLQNSNPVLLTLTDSLQSSCEEI